VAERSEKSALHYRFVNLFSHLIFVAIILLLISLVLMVFFHLVPISLSEWCLSLITLSQHRTHIRWAASDIKIVASLDAPFCFQCFCLFPASRLSLLLLFMHPHPRMSPKVILGHSRYSLGQLCSVRVQIIRMGGSLHLVSMCSIVSVVSHALHHSWCVRVAIVVQNFPIFWVPCIVLKRNCLILVWISCFHMLSHIVSSFSRDPVYSWMASCVFCRFSFVVCLVGVFLDSFIPLYAMAWVSVFSLGPCTLNSSGIVRLMWSSSSLFAPSFASSSLPLFPSFPSCLLPPMTATH